MTRTYIMLQKLSAELKRITDSTYGGAMSVIVVGLTGFFIVTLTFLFAADISIYSYKKRVIASTIDYAVCAAVQEIDTEKSKAGLARAFSGDGKVSMTGIYFDEAKADKAFSSTIAGNLNVDVNSIKDKMVRVMATPETAGIYYSIKYKGINDKGYVDNIELIENIINDRMSSLGTVVDSAKVYVNGNAASNSFEKRPYYMVFIRDYQIDGLISHRKATFICFKAAKIYR